jgi:hypothetical protein
MSSDTASHVVVVCHVHLSPRSGLGRHSVCQSLTVRSHQPLASYTYSSISTSPTHPLPSIHTYICRGCEKKTILFKFSPVVSHLSPSSWPSSSPPNSAPYLTISNSRERRSPDYITNNFIGPFQIRVQSRYQYAAKNHHVCNGSPVRLRKRGTSLPKNETNAQCRHVRTRDAIFSFSCSAGSLRARRMSLLGGNSHSIVSHSWCRRNGGMYIGGRHSLSQIFIKWNL